MYRSMRICNQCLSVVCGILMVLVLAKGLAFANDYLEVLRLCTVVMCVLAVLAVMEVLQRTHERNEQSVPALCTGGIASIIALILCITA